MPNVALHVPYDARILCSALLECARLRVIGVYMCRDVSKRYVPLEWEKSPAWNGLFYDKMASVSCRLSNDTLDEVRDFAARVPGLTDSGSLRLLTVIGLEVLRCVEHYSPEVLEDAIRDEDAALMNVKRIGSMVCPLVASCFDDVLSGGDE